MPVKTPEAQRAKCLTLFVLLVESHAKCLLNRPKAVLYIAAIAFQSNGNSYNYEMRSSERIFVSFPTGGTSLKSKGSKNKQPDFEQIQKALADEWQERLKKEKSNEPIQNKEESSNSSA